jgi:ubiquitin-like modifier-activating enzyme ATG7
MFLQPATIIGVDFWTKLYDLKLNKFKLDNSEKQIFLCNNEFTENSFLQGDDDKMCFLIDTNTIEEFEKIDKKTLLESKREYLLNMFLTHRNINFLNTKIILTFIDLKKYTFMYMVGNPTFVPDTQFEFEILGECDKYEKITNLNDEWKRRFDANKCIATNYKMTKELSFEWNFRNFLAFLSITNNVDQENTFCNIMCKTHDNQNILFRFNIPKYSYGHFKIIGWEKRKICDLSALLDVSKIVKQANDLNLKLMKWKMWETLDTDKISNTRCLLLGAGTLGCTVARLLVGWGFTNLTFVDNGVVSYSNPCRQSLYDIDDCTVRKYKAHAIVEKLLKVNPSLQHCSGYECDILCPDHMIIDEKKSFEDFSTLENLIATHDVIFTLTDDRESRWLPVVICTTHPNKILINVALGFDTYLISKIDTNNKENGCYFCTDIVSVYNSHINRTDDQKCTISRPGLSSIASGLAVEMLINFMHGVNLDIEQIRGNVIDYEIYCM